MSIDTDVFFPHLKDEKDQKAVDRWPLRLCARSWPLQQLTRTRRPGKVRRANHSNPFPNWSHTENRLPVRRPSFSLCEKNNGRLFMGFFHAFKGFLTVTCNCSKIVINIRNIRGEKTYQWCHRGEPECRNASTWSTVYGQIEIIPEYGQHHHQRKPEQQQRNKHTKSCSSSSMAHFGALYLSVLSSYCLELNQTQASVDAQCSLLTNRPSMKWCIWTCLTWQLFFARSSRIGGRVQMWKCLHSTVAPLDVLSVSEICQWCGTYSLLKTSSSRKGCRENLREVLLSLQVKLKGTSVTEF